MGYTIDQISIGNSIIPYNKWLSSVLDSENVNDTVWIVIQKLKNNIKIEPEIPTGTQPKTLWARAEHIEYIL